MAITVACLIPSKMDRRTKITLQLLQPYYVTSMSYIWIRLFYYEIALTRWTLRDNDELIFYATLVLCIEQSRSEPNAVQVKSSQRVATNHKHTWNNRETETHAFGFKVGHYKKTKVMSIS